MVQRLGFERDDVIAPPGFRLDACANLVHRGEQGLAASGHDRVGRIIVVFGGARGLRSFGRQFAGLEIEPDFVGTCGRQRPGVGDMPGIAADLVVLDLPHGGLLPLQGQVEPFERGRHFGGVEMLRFQSFQRIEEVVVPAADAQPGVFLDLLVQRGVPG